MEIRLLEPNYEGVRVTVLGAAGFIGRWVSRKLCQQKAIVHLIVRDRAAAEPVFDKYGIQGEVFQLDLGNLPALHKAFKQTRPAITFNLAGYGVDRSENDQKTAYQINTHLVEAIARAVSQRRDPDWPGQDIVHVGSAAEYGAIGGDLSEDSRPDPTTLYGKSKLAGTLTLKQCCKTLGIRGLTARLFSVYGPGEHPGRLLPSLLQTAGTKEPLALTSGEQMRDFTYVEDVAEGLLRLGVAEALPGEVVNLATGQLSSVRRFVEVAATVLGIPEQCLQFGAIAMPEREKDWDGGHIPVAVHRLRQLTDWLPSVGIEEGMHKTRRFESGGKG